METRVVSTSLCCSKHCQGTQIWGAVRGPLSLGGEGVWQGDSEGKRVAGETLPRHLWKAHPSCPSSTKSPICVAFARVPGRLRALCQGPGGKGAP